MIITIVDYGAGNIGSVQRACAETGVQSTVTSDSSVIRNAERIIFPGVGAAPAAMKSLLQKGLVATLRQAFESGIPILGICIGAQVVLNSSEEGDTQCLGLIPGATVRFRLKDKTLKVPHMGWNTVKPTKYHPLLDGLDKDDEFYFVHSYYPQPAQQKHIYAVTDYGGEFCCALGDKNLFAVQFHPEKSGRLGLRLLERFTMWDGSVHSGEVK
jgi:imidazole glycerol-phosphate synthase subunit HisH